MRADADRAAYGTVDPSAHGLRNGRLAPKAPSVATGPTGNHSSLRTGPSCIRYAHRQLAGAGPSPRPQALRALAWPLVYFWSRACVSSERPEESMGWACCIDRIAQPAAAPPDGLRYSPGHRKRQTVRFPGGQQARGRRAPGTGAGCRAVRREKAFEAFASGWAQANGQPRSSWVQEKPRRRDGHEWRALQSLA